MNSPTPFDSPTGLTMARQRPPSRSNSSSSRLRSSNQAWMSSNSCVGSTQPIAGSLGAARPSGSDPALTRVRAGGAAVDVEEQRHAQRMVHLLRQVGHQAGAAGDQSEAADDARREAEVGQRRAADAR